MRQLALLVRFPRTSTALLASMMLAGCGTSSPAGGAGGTGGTGGTGGAGGSAPAGTDAGSAGGGALPLVVTSVFNNQGWFADPTISAQFTPGSMVIRQADSIAGPCARRLPGASGKCLKVVYTPPAGVTPPAGGGGYVGVFMLTTLMHDHPELMPAARTGDANWGVEPGAPVPPGATKISFLAASETDGLMVTFKAGTDKDAFAVPETPIALTTAWKESTLPLGSQSYGSAVVGGFAWVLSDTSKPATFYLDGIIWQ
jgi:hypothetical protein